LRFRSAEILIVITSFNEDASMYSRSLEGIFANIQEISTSTRSKHWRNCVEDGDPTSQRITIALVVDGLDEMGEGVANLLAGMGAFQPDLLKSQIGGRGTAAHVFESVVSAGQLEAEGFPSAVPVQFILMKNSTHTDGYSTGLEEC
jgi:chitin synthase